jgi:glucose-1-phosphate adenylyltransferase
MEETVALPGVEVGQNCHIRKAILDRGCQIPDNMQIGLNHDEDRARGFRVSDGGVVLVTREMLQEL